MEFGEVGGGLGLQRGWGRVETVDREAGVNAQTLPLAALWSQELDIRGFFLPGMSRVVFRPGQLALLESCPQC